MRRVLVTGAGGFVGANLARRLVSEGHDVTAAVSVGNPCWRLRALRDQVRLIELDLRDRAAVERAISSHPPEWVFHLAAHGAYSWQRDTRRILETNLLATAALVDACANGGTAVLVHAGSSSEYGFKDHAPSEGETAEPNSAYAVGKMAATAYCRHVAREGRLHTVTLRLYSVFGPFEEPGRLIPTLVLEGLRGSLPPLVAPEVSRDFVYVDDVVEAFLVTASAADTSLPVGAVYNVGSGVPTSVGQVAEIACRLLPVRTAPSFGSHPGRSWDTNVWFADPSSIRSDLGWKARTSLEEGLASTIEWFETHPAVRAVYL